jgi:hypothetical protein
MGAMAGCQLVTCREWGAPNMDNSYIFAPVATQLTLTADAASIANELGTMYLKTVLENSTTCLRQCGRLETCTVKYVHTV